jgi:2-iminobutanoate/2-iminopropanoate deaminase
MTMKKIIKSDKAPEPIGPYNQAIHVDKTLYVSGQIALSPTTGRLNTGDIRLETRQVMENLHAILKEAGLDFNHVVKCTIFVKNMSDFQRINEIYGQYFSKIPPARETVEVSNLPKNSQVEISCIAVGE